MGNQKIPIVTSPLRKVKKVKNRRRNKNRRLRARPRLVLAVAIIRLLVLTGDRSQLQVQTTIRSARYPELLEVLNQSRQPLLNYSKDTVLKTTVVSYRIMLYIISDY